MRGPLGTARPLSLAALDAAISETIGRPVRADRLARDDRVYRWIVRRAIVEGSLRFNCTYAEAAAGAGYAVPRLNCRANRLQAREQRVSTLYRALCSLQAAGLVRFHGVKRPDGRWRCLSIALTPAGYGALAPFGRSRRGPRRCAGGRISFSRRNGTSPPVVTTKNGLDCEGVRAYAREGPPEGAGEGGGGFLSAALSPTELDSEAPGARPWPHEHFDLSDERAVLLVEAFERHFGIPARFRYDRHGKELRRALDRFDRYTGEAGDRFGYDAAGRRRKAGAGFKAALALIRQRGALYRTGNLRLQKVRSLAYFLPVLDQQSKKVRRTWRARHGLEVWGPTEEER